MQANPHLVLKMRITRRLDQPRLSQGSNGPLHGPHAKADHLGQTILCDGDPPFAVPPRDVPLGLVGWHAEQDFQQKSQEFELGLVGDEAGTHASKADYLRAINKLIGSKDQNNPGSTPQIASEHLLSYLPRLLLRGETGVGKTLIARYLQEEADLRPPRIPIPEYLGKEDMFEYDLFGYVHGAYTDGREDGDHGLLLENIGGVVFLDEIGEANEIIQAKLLAYLDDYRIRPRGWRGAPFYCPTLIVAASNRDLKDLVKKRKFRGDLLARFTDVETVPPLRQRVESLPFILDCLLQTDAINPGETVKEIGQEAFAALKKHEFPGNFRELEDAARTACQTVAKDGRNSICRSDLPF
jgi:sigma54-dependent transcription regulator